MAPFKIILLLVLILFVIFAYLVVKDIRLLINDKNNRFKLVIEIIMDIVTVSLLINWLFKIAGEFLL